MNNNLKKSFVGIALVFVALIGPVTAVSAANTLPTSDVIYIADSEGSGIYQLDSSGNQVLTSAKVGNLDNGFYGGGSLNPADYYVYLVYNEFETESCWLDRVDLAGTEEAVRSILKFNGVQLVACAALSFDSTGQAYIYGTPDDGETGTIFELDLKTMELSNPIATDHLYGFAIGPNDTWYGMLNTGKMLEINKTDGSTQILATVLGGGELYDAFDGKFDSEGTFWFSDEEGNGPPFQLYSWKPGDANFTLQGNMSLDGDVNAALYGPVFVTIPTTEIQAARDALPKDDGKEQLADTGIDMRLVMWTLYLLGFGLMLKVVFRRIG